MINFTHYKGKVVPISVAIQDVRFETTLKRLALSQVPLQVNHLR